MLNSSNSLLSDIAEEYHTHLLESGNLQKSRSSWTGENSWVSLGYEARLTRFYCISCHSNQTHLTGIFHKEKSPSGAIRLQPLTDTFQIPYNQNHPIVTTTEKISRCPNCLESRGFSYSTPPKS